jgi:phenylacetate-coenzyme A ligase PaaK-like adenylate-forming protein
MFDCYGATEVMWVAQGCAHHDGLMLCEDRAVIEPVDDEGNPVAAGETASRMLVTPLFSPTLPLIRYELTDRVTMATDRASCTPGFRRLAAVEGRRDDSFTYPAGTVVHPILFRSAILTERHVLEYQVRQTPSGADIHVVTSGAVDAARLVKLVEADLVHAGVPRPVVRVEQVESIARQGDAEKLPRMVPLPI